MPTWKKIIWIFFLITRIVIWFWRPTNFTEILFSYMPYAHAWESGYTPYLQHWYEYPPATIPLLFLPHLIDKHSDNQIPYLPAYRGMLLVIDCALFWFILATLAKFKSSPITTTLASWFYILATLKAHDFVYDSMDLVFAGALTLAAALPAWGNLLKYYLGSWISFWLATALKLINVPLAPAYFWLKKGDWKKELIIASLAFFIIWGLPLAIYRSSLSVMFVYHQQRGLQADSVGATISRTIGAFTHTETFIEVYKNYEISGPVSTQVKKIFDFVFPASLLYFTAYSIFMANRAKKPHHTRLQLTLVFIFLFMLTAKVLSRPFLLWQIPLITIYPFKSIKTQLKFILPSLIMITVSLTLIPVKKLGLFTTDHLIAWTRTLTTAYLLYQSFQLGKKITT